MSHEQAGKVDPGRMQTGREQVGLAACPEHLSRRPALKAGDQPGDKSHCRAVGGVGRVDLMQRALEQAAAGQGAIDRRPASRAVAGSPGRGKSFETRDLGAEMLQGHDRVMFSKCF